MRELLAVLMFLLLSANAYAAEGNICVAVYEKNFMNDFDTVHKHIKDTPVNCIIIPVVWQDVEAEKGVFDFSYYDPIVNDIISKGYKLAIMLDASGRRLPLASGHSHNSDLVHPGWVEQDRSLYAKDFMDYDARQLSFHSERAREYIKNFFAKTVEHYKDYPRDKLVAFAPGIQEEFELKYGQEGYRWRDFSDSALRDFRNETGFREPYVAGFTKVPMDQTKPWKGFAEYMSFRDKRLKDFVCDVVSPIREQGFRTLGYFGEIFAAHDGIYSTGAAGDMADCIDEAVIDYNFFDGYGQTFKVYKPAMMVNYMQNLGYSSVIAGLYVERRNRHINRYAGTEPAMGGVIAQVLSIITSEGRFQGFELGGLAMGLTNNLGTLINPLTEYAISSAPQDRKGRKIALAVSQANYDYYIGENKCSFNTAEESALRIYQILLEKTDHRVSVFSEKTLRYKKDFLKGYDMVVVPYQDIMHSDLSDAVKKYIKKGGRVIAFAGTGLRDQNGYTLKDPIQKTLGVKSIRSEKKISINTDHRRILFRQDDCSASGIYVLKYKGRNLAGKNESSLVYLKENNAVLGLNPALIQNDGTFEAEALFLKTVKSLLN